ncbi:Beta-glucanase [Dactylella cylindrospora]|nr:Beta-glucanase [Dactylella cylindrospora]
MSSSKEAAGLSQDYARDRGSTYSIISEYAGSHIQKPAKPFVTYRLQGKYQQVWLTDPRLNSKNRINNTLVYVLLAVGIAAGAVYCWTGYTAFPKHDYCLVLDDSFETIDPNTWNYEVQVDGFGNGQFDWTTSDPSNIYVSKDGLRIVPTLTNETTKISNDQIINGYTLNLTTDGSCTSQTRTACGVKSNSTKGIIINPVRSGRLTTKGKKGIRFGKIEIQAKLPAGDWMWPAIWMMPRDSVYGDWPRSGEIDIVESRGNNYEYPEGGVNTYSSALHWGPYPGANAYWRTMGRTEIRRSDFSQEFRTFGLEWTEDYIVTYVGSRIHQVMFIKFDKGGFWERGDFIAQNATADSNPWRNANNKAAPFDQEFYLLLNVAIGATNGYFKDSAIKPWIDGTGREMRDFWDAVDEWYPTWGPVEDRGMTIKRVKMWQQGKC